LSQIFSLYSFECDCDDLAEVYYKGNLAVIMFIMTVTGVREVNMMKF